MIPNLHVIIGMPLILDSIHSILPVKITALDVIQFMLDSVLALLIGQRHIYENRPAAIVVWCYRSPNSCRQLARYDCDVLHKPSIIIPLFLSFQCF